MRASRETGRRSVTEQARRAQIVAATIETIAEVGFTQATYARIARRAGLSSTGLISYHFAGKDDLINAVIIEIATTASERITARTETASSALGQLRARLEAELEWVATCPEQVRALYEISMNARSDDGSLQYGPGLTTESNVNELEPLLRAGQASGELREFDPVLVALTIKAAVDSAIYRMSIEPRLSAADCAGQIADLFERALRADGQQ